MRSFFNHHKLLFLIVYLLMPVTLGWIGYALIDDNSGGGSAVFLNANVIKETDAEKNAVSLSASTVLYQLPRVSLSMATGISGSGTMKLDIGLEVKSSELLRVKDYEPRIIDHIFNYMRGQSYEKLQEADSSRWIRKGLEQEISNGAVPIHVASVVIQRMVFE